MKRNLIILTLVVFACSSIFLLSSCAKKQVVAEEEEVTAPPEEVVTVEEEEPSIEVEFAEEEEEIEVAERVEIEEPEEVEVAEEREVEEEALPEIVDVRLEGESVYFDFDKSFIKPEYRATLSEKASILKDNSDINIRIEGNCDERGTNEYNIALGERRANSAKNFLISLGISSDRIETISYGEERPLFLGHDEDSWSRNRRDDFVIITE
ncbi:MAG: peptidoglycan-associated lipoprotein Pal [Deltaproteobacteria bacterium]|nr:MAG: peptidoglycan-associated lipoprotein Pal [Deltaproteobacteria bacterium]